MPEATVGIKWDTPPNAAPTNVKAVANTFIEFASQEAVGTDFTQMKLQKLAYYSHAWFLANYNYELFPEDVEAWPYGPVVKELYNAVHHFGHSRVNQKITDFRFSGVDKDGNVPIETYTPEITDEHIKNYLYQIWLSLKNYSAIQLSNLTHATNEPWTIVKSQSNLNSKPRIDNVLIRDVFAARVSKTT